MDLCNPWLFELFSSSTAAALCSWLKLSCKRIIFICGRCECFLLNRLIQMVSLTSSHNHKLNILFNWALMTKLGIDDHSYNVTDNLLWTTTSDVNKMIHFIVMLSNNYQISANNFLTISNGVFKFFIKIYIIRVINSLLNDFRFEIFNVSRMANER